MDNYIGKMLDDRYEILEVIGTGGMAVVYKAKCHRLNRLVAIKILKDEYLKDSEFRRRFQAESQAVAMLSHPNIVSVYDVSQSGDTDYIVMELIDGITLKQYMEKKGVLNWRETLHFSMQIAKALEHAHSRGIVHRDIKPHNIMILKNGSVKVADFGIARVSSSQSTLTREALGSVHYISPEQAKGSRVDNRSDLYSLGVVMYEMLTGRAPYDGESPVAVAIKHINAGAPMPSTINPNIPGGLEQITMHAMCANLDERYSSATEMLYDLEEFRKNPNILFSFHGESVPIMPKVTRIQEKTPAERRAEERARRKRLEEERKKAKKKRIRNIAIIAGGIVLILCIIVLLASSCSKKEDLVTVPNFEHMLFTELDIEDYPDFVLVEDSKEYSDSVEAGRIIRQSPAADKQVEIGTKILLVVSLGQRNDNMPDVIEMKANEAERLIKSLDMNLTIRIKTVYDEKIQKDRVVRTEPEVGDQLHEGQTVTIYVSLGPETPTVKVPKVEGEKLTKAVTLLTKAGLEYKKTYVDSDLEKNTVVSQSIDPGEEVEKGTVVELEISNGPKEPEKEPETDPEEGQETEPPQEVEQDPKPDNPPEPSEENDPGPADVMKTKVHSVSVDDHTESVTVDVICASTGEVCGETQQLEPGENAINIALTGSGSVTYNVYVNGTFYTSFTEDFN